MKGIILIEGPDGSGKTTLAKRLARDYNGIILHQTYRFKNKIPIYHGAILRKALKLSKERLVILDRLHISEYVYGKVFRNENRWPWMTDLFNILCKELNIPIIMCLPFSIQQGLEWFEKAKNERPEMFENIKEVIQEYIDYYDNNSKLITIYNKENNDLYDFYYSSTKAILEYQLNVSKY